MPESLKKVWNDKNSEMIPVGRYLIKLYGLRDGNQEPVADYPVSLVYR